MSGKMIFEAMTDIDDEFIEKAQNYRPHKVISYKVVSGLIAASLVLLVGIRTFLPLNVKSNSTSDCAVSFDYVESEAKDANGMQDNMIPKPENALGTNSYESQVQGIKGDTNSVMESVTDSGAIVLGMVDSYSVSIKNQIVQENEVIDYQIFLADANGEYLFENIKLNEKQKEAIQKMVNEYFEKLNREE